MEYQTNVKSTKFLIQYQIIYQISQPNQSKLMCYPPISCLKVIVFLGSISSIVISIGLLALTIYVNVDKKDIINTASETVVNGSLIALYISSIIFLLLGVAGLTGSMKGTSKRQGKGTCLLGLYSIGVAVFFLLFLGGTIFFFVGPQAIFGTDCKQGSKTNLIAQLFQTSQDAYKIFCSADCKCNIADSDLSKLFPQSVIDPQGYLKYSDCPNLPPTSTEQNILALATLQSILQCGGWCQTGDSNPITNYFYRFRNINDCNSQSCYTNLQSCHDKFQNFMTSKGQLVGFGCLAATLLCFINIVAVCCICFHPSKVGRSRNFYSRMIQV